MKDNVEEIKVKYLVQDLERLTKIDKGDWIDLRCAEETWMQKGDFKLIPLGIAMKLPEGYEAHIVPRSSTFIKWGLLQTNHMGVIDESYCGNDDEWKFPAYATRDVGIKKGDRICQFRIVKKQPNIAFIEVDSLDAESRGGFGSTGAS